MISGFCDLSGEPAVRGFMHVPERGNGHGIALTHGAGGDCESRLLRSIAGAFADAGYLVLRLNLPFRQRNPHGPPLPARAAQDREGLRRAASIMRSQVSGKLWVGGHSYGGRQATILAAENPGLAAGLILFSYPLHPPRKPTQLRTEHFPRLTVPALFVHGSRDPFGLPGGNGVRSEADSRVHDAAGSRGRRARPSVEESGKRSAGPCASRISQILRTLTPGIIKASIDFASGPSTDHARGRRTFFLGGSFAARFVGRVAEMDCWSAAARSVLASTT